MNLANMLTDDSWVENAEGLRTGPFKTKFAGSTLTFYDTSFEASEGDTVIQVLPSGKEKRYTVAEAQYRSGLGAIPASWAVKVLLGKELQQPSGSSVSYTINGTNVQVGNHNAQHITSTFQTLIADIDRAPFPEAQKAEAKSKLKAFLENPVTTAVLGGLAQGVVGKLG